MSDERGQEETHHDVSVMNRILRRWISQSFSKMVAKSAPAGFGSSASSCIPSSCASTMVECRACD